MKVLVSFQENQITYFLYFLKDALCHIGLFSKFGTFWPSVCLKVGICHIHLLQWGKKNFKELLTSQRTQLFKENNFAILGWHNSCYIVTLGLASIKLELKPWRVKDLNYSRKDYKLRIWLRRKWMVLPLHQRVYGRCKQLGKLGNALLSSHRGN